MNKEKLIEKIDKNIDTFSIQRETSRDKGYAKYCDATIYGLIVAKEIIESEQDETYSFTKEALAEILLEYANYMDDGPNWACDCTVEDAIAWINKKAGE